MFSSFGARICWCCQIPSQVPEVRLHLAPIAALLQPFPRLERPSGRGSITRDERVPETTTEGKQHTGWRRPWNNWKDSQPRRPGLVTRICATDCTDCLTPRIVLLLVLTDLRPSRDKKKSVVDIAVCSFEEHIIRATLE